MTSTLLPRWTDTGAHFSSCGIYRFRLWRRWSEGAVMCWVMLNPSTADERANDPTIERCERRARQMGFGGIEIANIFALRSTDPQALYGHPDPVGPDNDSAILAAARSAGLVVCGWGAHGKFLGRGAEVMQLLREAGLQPHCLAMTAGGQPRHPLYVSYAIKPSLISFGGAQ